ncbi:MAG TPA: glycosyltransferase family 2 protein [Terracidiphilus sp.]|nr:glycosyltransferase family 2 protein [Terracidiphilus sp.]
MELSIILVNYNGLAYLSGCLDSVMRFAPLGSEVILVDSASSDGSPDMVERNYPWVRLLRSGTNVGFTGGNNLAAAHANGDFLLLLNADTLLLEPLAPALEWLKENPKYGILTIGMTDGGGVRRACTGRFPTPARLAFLRRMLVAPDRYEGCEACEVDWVQGSFLLIRKHLWQALGGFNDRYFMYVEDIDLCKRGRDLGSKCGFLPQMRYTHFGGFSPARFPSQVANLALYVDQHMKGIRRTTCRAVLVLGCIARVLLYDLRALIVRDENSRIIESACRQALRTLIPRHSRIVDREFGVRP